jgi:hypothetical protein
MAVKEIEWMCSGFIWLSVGTDGDGEPSGSVKGGEFLVQLIRCSVRTLLHAVTYYIFFVFSK